ncbi:hypothetical protein [Rhodococcus pyridinivorans]|uniref:Uncharacterized protein n=1 Tax=Rhodococcus pyridinivorans TaxID=103816 RepID=A0A7M2XRF2_9NOCA|nr:hypothetical protein [Rhodococcus pyridinivorans]QOV99510.1 hypothetical protein INP59_03665 [Rhodococcus pyridinivorans]
MANTSIDLEATLAQALHGLGWVAYGGELPAKFEQRGLPAVRVIELPGRETARAWNGPGLLHERDVDIDVFDTDADKLADATARLRADLETFRTEQVAVTSVPAFTRRPDWNDKVRRRGAVLSLVTR